MFETNSRRSLVRNGRRPWGTVVHGGARMTVVCFLSLTAFLGSMILNVDPAFAINCSAGASDGNRLGATWSDTDGHVAGVRAPVQFLNNGGPCVPQGNTSQGVSNWIGIQGNGLYDLSQIGVEMYSDPNGTIHKCKFFEVLPNPPTFYGCGLSNGYTFFEVYKYNHGSDYYAGNDCGSSSDYSICTLKFSLVPVYGPDFDALVAESNRSACENFLMGSSSNPANIGDTTNPAEVKHDIGDAWKSGEALNPYSQDGSPTCGDYHKSLPHPNVVTTWDDRNG